MNKDKIYGIILGHALGDALGSPVEFYPYAHYTGILDTPIIRYNRAYGKQISDIGQVSDDTEMAIILIKTIIDGYTKEKAVINYMLWANNNYKNCKGKSPFMGKNTRNLFVAPKSTYKLYENRFNKYYNDPKIMEESQSNGALMRAYAHIFTNLDENILKTDVFITNPSKLTYNCVYVYLSAIKMAIENKNKEYIKINVRKLIEFDSVMKVFDEASNNIFRNVTINKGHILHALYCAFWGLFQFDNYKDAIDAIICLGPEVNSPSKICLKGKWKKNEIIVSDTDTNAAIAGALLGSYYGYEEIIKNPIIKKNIDVMLNSDSTKGDIIRPSDYKLTIDFIEKLCVMYK